MRELPEDNPALKHHIIMNPENVNEGNVGIGTEAPDSKLHVVGNLHISGDATKDTAGGSWISSDLRLKKDVEPIADALAHLAYLLDTQGDTARAEVFRDRARRARERRPG